MARTGPRHAAATGDGGLRIISLIASTTAISCTLGLEVALVGRLRAADPDVILITPCGFDIPRTLAELPALPARPGWAERRAVQSGRLYVADGNQFFNRPGPRLVESLEILAELCHPAVVRFGHAGTGWRPVPAG